MIHKLKISPDYFDVVARGVKPFEVRKNDRDFKVGDVLKLSEFIPCVPGEWNVLGGFYTTRETRKVITYILDDPDYCKEGYVILGLAPAEENE